MGLSKGKKPVQGGQDKDVVKAAEAIREKTPTEKAQELYTQRWWDYQNRTGEYANKALDITTTPGFDLMETIYGSADAARKQRKVSNPSTAFRDGSNSGYGAQLEAENAFTRFNARAQGLAQGAASARDQAFGLSGQVVANDITRGQGYSQALGQYNNNFYNRPQKPPLWQTIAGLAIGGLGAAGGVGGLQKLGCWIAMELYGPIDPRTLLLRFWLNTEFIKRPVGWLVMVAYVQFGERMAERIKHNSLLRRGFKRLFDWALIKAERWERNNGK